jgi:hypothetical protein
MKQKRGTRIRPDQAINLMNEALDERGIVCLHVLDQGLTDYLCEVIGALHRTLTAQGLTDNQINEAIRKQLA